VSPLRSFSRSEGRRRRSAACLALLALLLGGCSSLSYYAQSVRGHLGVAAAARPLEDVMADPATSDGVRRRLAELPALRRFAVEELALPDSDSYRRYADVRREALVWAVVAAPSDSLEPREWCYPIIGCAAYRGYFSVAAADAYAATLRAAGWDVAVEPVPAYSTLGWFSDPLPSTVIGWPLPEIAALVFHELAHEALYLPGDSAFNEAYATLVAQEGVRRWLARHGDAAQQAAWRRKQQKRRDFLALLARTRARLAALYASDLARERMRQRKAEIFATLRDDYAALKRSWGGYDGYERWFARPLNNAHVASIGTYHGLEPAFRRLLQHSGGDMAAFHAACRDLAALSEDERAAALHGLLGAAPAG
jgi:predicted aminopeptidase